MINSILLQAQPGGSPIGSILMIVAMFAIMYFLIIRPQQKKQEEIKKFRASLKVGSKVVTAGGIHGVIRELDATCATVEIAQNVKVKIDINSIFASADSGVIENK